MIRCESPSQLHIINTYRNILIILDAGRIYGARSHIRGKDRSSTMSKAVFYIVSIGLIWLIVCAIWPYLNQYGIKSDLKAAALYGTKHSIEDTTKFLSEKLKERGYNFGRQKFHIEKDENNAVSISLTCQDEISFFDFILKKLEFTLDVTKHETEEYF